MIYFLSLSKRLAIVQWGESNVNILQLFPKQVCSACLKMNKLFNNRNNRLTQ